MAMYPCPGPGHDVLGSLATRLCSWSAASAPCWPGQDGDCIHCSQYEIETGLDAGIDAFVAKPFEPADLVCLVRQFSEPKRRGADHPEHPEDEPAFEDIFRTGAGEAGRAERIGG